MLRYDTVRHTVQYKQTRPARDILFPPPLAIPANAAVQLVGQADVFFSADACTVAGTAYELRRTADDDNLFTGGGRFNGLEANGVESAQLTTGCAEQSNSPDGGS